MPYTRLNLQDGQVLDAEHIKHIEDGIVSAGQAQISGELQIVPTLLKDGTLVFMTNPVNNEES